LEALEVCAENQLEHIENDGVGSVGSLGMFSGMRRENDGKATQGRKRTRL